MVESCTHGAQMTTDVLVLGNFLFNILQSESIANELILFLIELSVCQSHDYVIIYQNLYLFIPDQLMLLIHLKEFKVHF